MIDFLEITEGVSPIILSQPHGGARLVGEIADRLNATGRALADTDWHIARLYEDVHPGVTVVRTHLSRYVIDVNRDPSGDTLYPGQSTTELCPLSDFDGRPIYLQGAEPTPDEIAVRRRLYHAPYHAALEAQIARLRARHRQILVYDCHSIRSEIPRLFPSRLPALNLGTDSGRTVALELQRIAESLCREVETADLDWVANGRFRGGWTTRQYGRPQAGVHAFQLECAQRVYMDEAPPWTYRTDKAERLRHVIGELLRQFERWLRG